MIKKRHKLPHDMPHRKPDGQTLFLGFAIVAAAAVLAFVVFFRLEARTGSQPAGEASLTLDEIPFNGARAFRMLDTLCQLGSRMSGSKGMLRQQELLQTHFQRLGGEVEFQRFRVRHPETGEPVGLANLIVHWHPERQQRILLCAHYDTRPFPDRDPLPERRRDTFVGANDGASGVAVLAEMAYHLPALKGDFGVDLVLFDGEEFVFDDRRDDYFLGSQFFAEQYVKEPPPYEYRWAVLLDMVGDANLQIYQERHSVGWRDTRPLVKSIWATARRLGVREFIPRPKYEIRDDHLPLHNTAGIPSCDVIDFDYPRPGGTPGSYWHTTQDTPDKCAPLSLAKVGWVLLEWLRDPPP